MLVEGVWGSCILEIRVWDVGVGIDVWGSEVGGWVGVQGSRNNVQGRLRVKAFIISFRMRSFVEGLFRMQSFVEVCFRM